MLKRVKEKEKPCKKVAHMTTKSFLETIEGDLLKIDPDKLRSASVNPYIFNIDHASIHYLQLLRMYQDGKVFEEGHRPLIGEGNRILDNAWSVICFLVKQVDYRWHGSDRATNSDIEALLQTVKFRLDMLSGVSDTDKISRAPP